MKVLSTKAQMLDDQTFVPEMVVPWQHTYRNGIDGHYDRC